MIRLEKKKAKFIYFKKEQNIKYIRAVRRSIMYFKMSTCDFIK